jgi:hypothetical protein
MQADHDVEVCSVTCEVCVFQLVCSGGAEVCLAGWVRMLAAAGPWGGW